MKLSRLYPQLSAENEDRHGMNETAIKAKISFSLEEENRAELSADPREMQKMQNILQQTPEVRADRIRAIKGLIENGEYSVEPQALADKLLQDFINNHFA